MDVPVRLLLAEAEERGEDESLGWSKYAEVEIVKVAGDHYRMLELPLEALEVRE